MTKKFTAKDATERDLIIYGRDHILAARALAETHKANYYDSAVFLYHLGLELFLKAILLHFSKSFVNKHTLVALSNMINAAKPTSITNEFIAEYRRLDQFWNIKYPSRSNPIEVGDETFEHFETMIDKTWLLIPQDIRESALKLKYNDTLGHDVFEKGGRVLFEKPIS